MMIFLNTILLIFLSLLGKSFGAVPFYKTIEYRDCEGKGAENYTSICPFVRDDNCEDNVHGPNDNLLISYDAHGNKVVNSEINLAASLYPAGAYEQSEVLRLIISGKYQGKYVYEKTIQLSPKYLKKCSSVLGYAYSPVKTGILLISDTLDVTTLISPIGAFKPFQNNAIIRCKGSGYFV